MAERSPLEKPVWFITGCSTGFGHELAKILLARGYRVVATARDPRTLADVALAKTAANDWPSTSPTTPASRRLSRRPATSTS